MLNNYWKKFLAETGRDESTKYAWSICFGMDKASADCAAERVVRGEKTAMIYPADGYRANMNRPLERGDFIIVCDWQEKPRAVAEVLSVRSIALGEISDAHCAVEAEAESLDAWKEIRLPAIKIEIEEVGGEFRDDAPLVFVEFRTAYTGA
ncbi:MAG: ASCH domain-containing protein [Clostridia bacterium]|nr:ASCH domain-containing protein [Clostridia bacterium]